MEDLTGPLVKECAKQWSDELSNIPIASGEPTERLLAFINSLEKRLEDFAEEYVRERIKEWDAEGIGPP